MAKQLLRSDIVPIKISTQQINESKTNNNGKLILYNIILQRADAENANGRIYPKHILLREANRYDTNCVKVGNALGELDHPETSTVSLERGALNIIRMFWKGDDLMGDVEILTHLPKGQILEGYLKHGITIGISSRGLGSVKESAEHGVVEVQDDYEILSFDAVSTPSTQGAYMRLAEGKNQPTSFNLQYINAIVDINYMIDEILFSNKK